MENNKVKINTNEAGFTGYLYGSPVGRFILKLFITPTLSKICGAFMSCPLSRLYIKRFIKINNIDMSDYPQCKYRSFNDFFTRKVLPEKRPLDRSADAFISPCDSRLTAYVIDDDSVFNIKGSVYSVADILQDKALASEYKGGMCLIFRLAVNDYHRYHYIDNGSKCENIYIKGKLHTVRPIALHRVPVFKQNCREYTVLNTERFGKVVQIEVGAMMVGKIYNLQDSGVFKLGQEKGRFLFGGSTVVMLIKKDQVKLDPCIFENTANDYETIIKMGQKIGSVYHGGNNEI